MAEKSKIFSKKQTEEVISIFRRQLLTWGIAFLAIFTSITGLSLWGIKKQVENIAIQRIANQFEEPQISSLMKQVAEQQSKSILEEEVNPEVTRFKKDVNSSITEFDSYLTELKTKYEQDYTSLSSEIAILKKRNGIMKLGDLGTEAADRSALEELEKISVESEDDSLKIAAKSEIARIKSFWSGVTRLKARSISKIKAGGEMREEEDLTTEELIEAMLSHAEWEIRALAARALGKRKEKAVAEALMKCVKNDRDLEVVKEAVKAFESVTGYESPDVFSSGYIEKWWAKYGEETILKFQDAKSGKTESRN